METILLRKVSNPSFPYTIEYRLPTISEFKQLRQSTGWEILDDLTIEKGLVNSIFCICITFQNTVIGMGRIVGDGSMYFYIQDVIVLPDFKKKGVGKAIMIELEKYINKNAHKNSFIGLMAATGSKDFYLRFGYKERDVSKPGMYKIMN